MSDKSESTQGAGRNTSRRDLFKNTAILAAAATVPNVVVAAADPAPQNAAAAPATAAPTNATAPVNVALPDGKKDLIVLGDRPMVAETPVHLLDPDVTPLEHFFIRNNGTPPELENVSDDSWKITIDGEVETPLTLSIADLKRDFQVVKRRLVIECAGNGRKFYNPPASGSQWTFGGVGCAEFTGVRLKDVLNKAKVKPSAVYTGHYGADSHLSGNPEKTAISRGVPIAKAMDENNLIVWEMNGEPLPMMNGFPLRLIVPGWPGSVSEKWLTRIWVRDKIHDGEKMGGKSYRMPAYPVAPGVELPDEDMVIITSLPVKSLITFPQTGTKIPRGEKIKIRGHAWSSEIDVDKVDVSIDFGQTWIAAKLDPLPNKYAWQRFSAEIMPPIAGYYEVWARATDKSGNSQPPVTPGWNSHGYVNNMQHRIAVFVL